MAEAKGGLADLLLLQLTCSGVPAIGLVKELSNIVPIRWLVQAITVPGPIPEGNCCLPGKGGILRPKDFDLSLNLGSVDNLIGFSQPDEDVDIIGQIIQPQFASIP